jgi:hypothetical protein
METLIKESLLAAKLTAKEHISGGMAKSMMVSGTKAKSPAMVSGKASMGIPISASGKIARQKAMEFMYGLMEIDMKESGTCVSDMEMELTSLQMEITIPANTCRESHPDLVNTNGQTETPTLENLNSDRNMVKVNGRKALQIWMTEIDSINMMDTMKWIKSMVMVLSSGSQEMSIRVTIIMMSVKDMERCSGPIKVSSKVTGSKEFSKELVLWYSQMGPKELDFLTTTYISFLLRANRSSKSSRWKCQRTFLKSFLPILMKELVKSIK